MMAIILLGVVLLLTPSLLLAAETDSLTMEQLVNRTQEAYDRTVDLKARFIQEITIQAMKKTEREEGIVTIKNPRMMYWDYTKPNAKKLIINAQTAWLYLPEDRLVYVQKADDVYNSRTAVKFLSGIGRLAEDFVIRFAKKPAVDAEGNYLLMLTAKEAGNDIDHLLLTIDGRSYQIIECQFNDALGNLTRLRFGDIRRNTGVPDRFFTFKTPEGVEEIPLP